MWFMMILAAQAQIWVGHDGYVKADIYTDGVEIEELTVSLGPSQTKVVSLTDTEAWVDVWFKGDQSEIELVELCADGVRTTVDLVTGEQTDQWVWFCGSSNVRIEGEGFSIEGSALLPDLDLYSPRFEWIWASTEPIWGLW